MVAAGGISIREGNQRIPGVILYPPRCVVKRLNWIHGPLGQNRVVQYHGLKNSDTLSICHIQSTNPDTSGIRSDTPDIGSDTRSAARILRSIV